MFGLSMARIYFVGNPKEKPFLAHVETPVIFPEPRDQPVLHVRSTVSVPGLL